MENRLEYLPDPDEPAERLVYTFGGVEAALSIVPGQVVSTWTRDCFNGTLRSARDLASVNCDARFLNPQTGPFWVEGAEPGDTVAVHFISIRPRSDWGVSATVPFFGSLTSTTRTASLQMPLQERTWIYEIDTTSGVVRYRAHDSSHVIDLPLDPMHGTVGVAPALGEVRSSLTPGPWGGNLDTPEMRAGATCYLGVNVEGALLSLGDGHARQGEGEACGVAVETAMETVFMVELVKQQPTTWPRLETDDHIMSTGSARPLEDAFRISQADLVHWVSEEVGLSVLDAYQLVAQATSAPIANVVDTDYTCVAKVAKRFLPGMNPYDGVHSRLRSAAKGLQRQASM